ncbi:MAG: hypothetical protein IT427_11465 [Pirellulales bacterium]|nr:hypothetical protein [Pirellulales bacterium]
MCPLAVQTFLTPDARLAEIAGILATGILRLHAQAARRAPAAEEFRQNPAKSTAPCLEVPEKPVLTVHTG